MGRNAQRRRLAKAAARTPGRNAMDPRDPKNIARLMRQAGTTRAERRAKQRSH